MRYRTRPEAVLSLPVPLETMTNKAAVAEYARARAALSRVLSLHDGEVRRRYEAKVAAWEAQGKKRQDMTDPIVRPIVPFAASLSTWASVEMVRETHTHIACFSMRVVWSLSCQARLIAMSVFQVPDFFSPAVRRNVVAIRSARLATYPRVLCIQLMKFRLNPQTLQPTKINVRGAGRVGGGARSLMLARSCLPRRCNWTCRWSSTWRRSAHAACRCVSVSE